MERFRASGDREEIAARFAWPDDLFSLLRPPFLKPSPGWYNPLNNPRFEPPPAPASSPAATNGCGRRGGCGDWKTAQTSFLAVNRDNVGSLPATCGS